MTAKEYLSQYRELDVQIQARYEYALRLHALAEKKTAVYAPHEGSTGSFQDTRYDVVAQLVDVMQELDADVDELIKLKREIEQAIATVEPRRLRVILELRYLNGKSWRQISRMLFIDERWVYRLHGEALKQIKIRHV